jgi:hypothetical protein
VRRKTTKRIAKPRKHRSTFRREPKDEFLDIVDRLRPTEQASFLIPREGRPSMNFSVQRTADDTTYHVSLGEAKRAVGFLYMVNDVLTYAMKNGRLPPPAVARHVQRPVSALAVLNGGRSLYDQVRALYLSPRGFTEADQKSLARSASQERVKKALAEVRFDLGF